MLTLRSVREGEFKNKRIVMRVDYNVSLREGLRIVDDTRIQHTLPTIRLLLAKGAKRVVLMSHLGRPGGRKVPRLSLRPVAKDLERLLGERVSFEEEVMNGDKENKNRVVMLENLRFWPGEKVNDKEFAKSLAEWGEVYVNDAFGASHRRHASIVGVAQILPSYGGLSLNYEVKTILQAVEKPKRPLVVIVGGAKVRDKIGMLKKLVGKADAMLIGGGMANTFLASQGYKMRASLVEQNQEKVARELLAEAQLRQTRVYLPKDVVVGDLKRGVSEGVVEVTDIPEGKQALDIGPRTQVEFGKVIAQAGTVIWNGPMGVFEKMAFRGGTDFIYYSLTENTKAFVVVGGGDTLAAISKKEHLERINHISTGGGAMLELIEKGTLPGIEYLVVKR